MMKMAESIYRKNFVHRYDDAGYLHYFSAKDFPGLRDEHCGFYSGKNRLSAHLYSREDSREEILVVFCHGIGGGHRSYLQEIHQLTLRGFPVFAYDNTGCFDSEGESIRCACEEDVLEYLRSGMDLSETASILHVNINLLLIKLAEMNRLGILVDVSHLSDGGFFDVAEVSRKPFVASHSNARAVTNQPRNLSDLST